jgi:hypothetical protein
MFQVARVPLPINRLFSFARRTSNTSCSQCFGGPQNPLPVGVSLISRTVMVPDLMKLVALLPYTIFSLFHALTFTRTTIIPHILPPGPPASAGGPPQAHPVAKKLQAWVKCKLITSLEGYSKLVTLRFLSQLRHCDEGCGIHRALDHGPNSLGCHHLAELATLPHLLCTLLAPTISPFRIH